MDTMNALVWKGDGALSLERRPIPALQGPRDAIVRVTRSTICTSDLHIRSGALVYAEADDLLRLWENGDVDKIAIDTVLPSKYSAGGTFGWG